MKVFWEKYKAFIIFIVVFLIAFFGTRALMLGHKKDKAKTTINTTP
ncbi:hypothetical protein [Flavobacterium sp. 3HN19-14]